MIVQNVIDLSQSEFASFGVNATAGKLNVLLSDSVNETRNGWPHCHFAAVNIYNIWIGPFSGASSAYNLFIRMEVIGHIIQQIPTLPVLGDLTISTDLQRLEGNLVAVANNVA